MNKISKIEKARIQLLLHYPFFGQLALYLELQRNNDVPTAGVDGVTLFYNEKWCNSLTDKELKGIVCHEVLHCALGHLVRKRSRNKIIWNLACDFATNDIIKEVGLQLPNGILYDKKYSGLSAEEIYKDLIKNAQKSSSMRTIDKHIYGKNKEEQKKLEEQWESRFIGSYQSSKMAGNVPEEIQRLIDKLLRPKISWKEILQKYVTETLNRVDYSWIPPSHKYYPLYVPKLTLGEKLEIILAIDTSGSIERENLRDFLSEIQGILETYDDYRLSIYDCDCSTHEPQEFFPGKDLRKLKLRGGGGTSFGPVFSDIKKRNVNPRCLLYFTDGEADFPQQPPYDIIWVLTKDHHRPSYGKIVVLDK